MEMGWPSGSHLTTKDVCVYTQCAHSSWHRIEASDTTQLQSCCLHSTFLVPRDFFALPHILFLEEWPIFASIVASSF